MFHDAYKGWSCCNKKSVDFTEFLNIKGCTKSKHSNVVSFNIQLSNLYTLREGPSGPNDMDGPNATAYCQYFNASNWLLHVADAFYLNCEILA